MTNDTNLLISLANMEVNQEGIIKSLEGGANFHARLQALNIRIGKHIKKVSKAPFGGPVVVDVDNSRVAIGHGMSKKIMVEVMEKKIAHED
ncbi:ferrous iron transport protein A [bacterium]|nr:ferrous iron transport protein A [bacterium]